MIVHDVDKEIFHFGLRLCFELVLMVSRDCSVALPRGALGLSAVCDCVFFRITLHVTYFFLYLLPVFICCLRSENALARMCLYAFIYVAIAIAIRHCYTQLKFRHFMCWLANVKS